ncbi:kinesin-like protein KIN-1 isoform X4 [Cryptomeria japonica]|uniref:kinesin-like protein KIN-1 isoform X4 n=1 Tax=Cryptomeria japonica TaxID=3369 RepID=UPI0027DA2616|nr:kinesin-like protein KIN-1 isoform X4 [Cryptomeria japonica]
MFSEPTQFGAKSFYKQFSCVIVDSRSQALKMSNVSVCVRFRPLNARELKHGAEASCVRRFDDQSFVFKEDKEGEFTFCFDRIYYQDSTQAEVFEFLALPIIKDAMNAINGTILTYGQTGAGKTHSMEGPSILTTDQQQKGILPRVIEYIFTSIEAADTTSEFIIKLSMVEIYMERISVKTGKLYLVDLAGSEKVEKTGAEGKILHEAKTINKSLSALGNVINALTTDKPCHIPYRDSKLTRILQESLGGNSRTALLCCCSPSSFNASESLSTLRFGTRAKQIRNKPKVNKERGQHELEQLIVKYEQECEQLRRQLLMLNARLHSLEKGEMNKMSTDYPDSCIKTYNKDGLLGKLKESLSKRTPVLEEIINLLRDLLVEEGIILESCNTEFRKDLLVSSEAEINKTILILQKSLEQLSENNETLTRENESLKVELRAARYLELNPLRFTENPPSNSSGSASFTICEKAKIIRPIRGGSQYTQVIDSAKSHRENAGNVASLSFLQLTLANIKSRFLFLMGKV